VEITWIPIQLTLPSLEREGEEMWGGWKLRGYRFNSPCPLLKERGRKWGVGGNYVDTVSTYPALS